MACVLPLGLAVKQLPIGTGLRRVGRHWRYGHRYRGNYPVKEKELHLKSPV